MSLSIYYLLFLRTSLEKPYFSRLFLLKLVISQAPYFPLGLLRAIMSFRFPCDFLATFDIGGTYGKFNQTLENNPDSRRGNGRSKWNGNMACQRKKANRQAAPECASQLGGIIFVEHPMPEWGHSVCLQAVPDRIALRFADFL